MTSSIFFLTTILKKEVMQVAGIFASCHLVQIHIQASLTGGKIWPFEGI